MSSAAVGQNIEYAPFDDRTQVFRQVERYPSSHTRVPSAPLHRRALTLTELTGPTGLATKWNVGKLDLSRTVPGGPRAVGQLLRVSGRVTDEDGTPLPGLVMEMWQANSAGKYIHYLDDHPAPLDANFHGQGRLLTDAEGRYDVFTIKPGAYPVLASGFWWRPPHIHFSIFGPSWMSRFVTQIFFPGEPLNETDLLLNAVPDRDVRNRLIFEFDSTSMGAVNAIAFRRDFVLRGRRRTPAME